jgi:glutamate synthase (NADPH/NADH) large chain
MALRPARYLMTDEGVVMMASEMGVLKFPEEKIVKKWRLEPGKMLLIDLQAGRIIDDGEVKKLLASAKPYEKWIKQSRFLLSDIKNSKSNKFNLQESLLDMQQAFGFTQEDINFIIKPMIDAGQEPSGSMGNDAALPVLSNKPKMLYNYFKQLFAQVTNPPIDPIREELVMSLVTFIGPRPNLLGIEEDNPPKRLEANQPVLTIEELEKLKNIENLTNKQFKSILLDTTYTVGNDETDGQALERAVSRICDEANKSVRDGYNIIILSDRLSDNKRQAIPALLACSATHQYLVKAGNRTNTGLVIDTGSAREVHHFALLAGYGAEAVCPWLTFETINSLTNDFGSAQEKFIKAIGKGLYKVMSKMGISTYQSYCGAQIFEAVGLNQIFVDKYFKGTATNIEGNWYQGNSRRGQPNSSSCIWK